MTRREVLERLYEEGSFEGEHRDIHPDRIEIALQELAQIEESKRLGIDELWVIFADKHGCKPDKEDCSFKRCHNWAECSNLIEAIHEAQRAKNERGEEDTIRLDWLDKHCSFVADEPYRIGPYKVGELRKMADDGLETDRKLGNCICMDCGEVIKTTEQSKHDKICSLKESMKSNLKEDEG